MSKKSKNQKSEELNEALDSESSLVDLENDPQLLASQAALAAEEFGFVGEQELVVEEAEEIDEEAAIGSELEAFDSAQVEDATELSEDQIVSVVESLLFATEKPMTVAAMKAAFAGTRVKVADIRKALQALEAVYADPQRGVTLEEISGGYQLRTKAQNVDYLRQTVKARPFRLSGPALEVLSLVAYKQPCTKSMVDEVRGVESGHLMRGLLERGIIRFGEKSDLPGRPMFYETTKKFLEVFGLRNLKELPSLGEIDQLLPEGIDDGADKKESLGDLTGRLSQKVGSSYSEGEEELGKISEELSEINTSTEFFEQEKLRMKAKADADRAQDIQEKLLVGEEVSVRDRNWLEKYQMSLLTVSAPQEVAAQPEVGSQIEVAAQPAEDATNVNAATEAP